jgi:hypothetical protein
LSLQAEREQPDAKADNLLHKACDVSSVQEVENEIGLKEELKEDSPYCEPFARTKRPLQVNESLIPFIKKVF